MVRLGRFYPWKAFIMVSFWQIMVRFGRFYPWKAFIIVCFWRKMVRFGRFYPWKAFIMVSIKQIMVLFGRFYPWNAFIMVSFWQIIVRFGRFYQFTFVLRPCYGTMICLNVNRGDSFNYSWSFVFFCTEDILNLNCMLHKKISKKCCWHLFTFVIFDIISLSV